MKTLYININGETIRSDNNIEVIGSEDSSITDSFYIYLGEAIANEINGIRYKPLIVEYFNAKPNEFKTFTDQWKEVKKSLLGATPHGYYEFTLSFEYLDWLKTNATYSIIYYKKYQGQHQVKIKLNLEELYADIVGSISRKVIRFLQTNDNYKNFDEFVVNDDSVTRHSLLVRSIKSTFENMTFVLFEKWESDTKESVNKDNIMPKCGKNPCDCITEEEDNGTERADLETRGKNIANKCLFIAVTQKEEVKVIDSNGYDTIYEGEQDERDINIVSENGHDVLYIQNGYQRWMKITPDGKIQRELTYDQTSMCEEPPFDEEEFLTKYPTYELANSIGYLKKEKVHVVITGNENHAEVRTHNGQLLFKIGNPYNCRCIPSEVTSSNLIITEDRDGHKGLWDIQGRELLSCTYQEINEVKCKGQSSNYLELIDEDFNTYLYNIHTKEMCSDITEYNIIRNYEEGGLDYIDVIDMASNRTVLEHICHNSGMTHILVDGWFRIHEWGAIDGYMNTLSYILVRGSNHFRMPSKGEILEEIFSSGLSPNERYFISENRIITYMMKENGDNSICAENMEYINIRDYNGNIINTKRHPVIWPLHPYRYGKVLAFKIVNDVYESLVYLDDEGQEHNIQGTSTLYFEQPYMVANDGKCTFVSKDTFIIDCSNSEERDYKLMDIKGNVLIDNAWYLEELSSGYILYAKDYNKIGVVDNHGFEIVRPLYKGLTVIREKSVKDEFQKFRLFM